MIRFWFVFLIFLTGFGCQAQEKEAPEYLNYQAFLKPTQEFSFSNKRIKFVKVLADSRCPKGVTCIWAGNFEILVEYFVDGASQGTAAIKNHSETINNFFDQKLLKVSGLKLLPYPEVDKRIPEDDYILSLNIQEKLN